MLRKLIDRYVRKYWGEDYYHKDELPELCDRVRADEAARKDEEWGGRLEELRVSKDRELHLKMIEFQNIVDRALEEVSEYKEKMKEAADLRYSAVTGAQGNLHIASSMAVKVNELRDVLAKLTGSLMGIENEARTRLKALESIGSK